MALLTPGRAAMNKHFAGVEGWTPTTLYLALQVGGTLGAPSSAGRFEIVEPSGAWYQRLPVDPDCWEFTEETPPIAGPRTVATSTQRFCWGPADEHVTVSRLHLVDAAEGDAVCVQTYTACEPVFAPNTFHRFTRATVPIADPYQVDVAPYYVQPGEGLPGGSTFPGRQAMRQAGREAVLRHMLGIHSLPAGLSAAPLGISFSLGPPLVGEVFELSAPTALTLDYTDGLFAAIISPAGADIPLPYDAGILGLRFYAGGTPVLEAWTIARPNPDGQWLSWLAGNKCRGAILPPNPGLTSTSSAWHDPGLLANQYLHFTVV